MEEMEKPEGLPPGKLMDRIAACPYCGQRHYVRASANAGEEELSLLAVEECDCSRAQTEAGIREKVGSVASQIQEKYTGLPQQAREALLSALWPVAAGGLKKASFDLGNGVTFTVYRKNGKLKTIRTYTEQDEIEE